MTISKLTKSGEFVLLRLILVSLIGSILAAIGCGQKGLEMYDIVSLPSVTLKVVPLSSPLPPPPEVTIRTVPLPTPTPSPETETATRGTASTSLTQPSFNTDECLASTIGDAPFSQDFQHKLLNNCWVAYAPTSFDPERGIFPPEDSIREDLRVLRRAGFDGLVTYSADEVIHGLAQEAGFQGMILGVWEPTNTEEMRIAEEAAPYDVVIGYVLGNEGLDQRYDYATLEAAMDKLRQVTGKPVATTEEWGDYLNPQVMNLGDWVFPNVHPYWHGVTDPMQAVDWTEERFNELAAGAGNRPVVFKEVGLPTDGDEDVDEERQADYYRLLQDTSVDFVYFEAFDQPWKDWAPVEPHWGLFRQDRSPKQVVQHVCQPPSLSSGPYGVVEDLAYDPPENLEATVDLMARAGIQYIRMDFRWYLIEPGNDTWNFEGHDRIVQALENRGIQIVGLLDDVPTWANGQSGPWSGTYPPENLEDWSDYMFHVADHYESQITCWELWNEENIAQYFQPQPDADRYVQLLRAGYEAIKQANPGAVILLGGLAGNGINVGWEPPESQDFLQRIYDSGGKDYFDIVNIHPYVHPFTSTHGLPAGIEGLRDTVEATQAVMIANDDHKPIWITEIGWSTAPDAWGQPTVSEAGVADWLETVYTAQPTLGVQKIFWYNFRDSGPDPNEVEHNFGLVRHDLAPKPAYWQYKALARRERGYLPLICGSTGYMGPG